MAARACIILGVITIVAGCYGRVEQGSSALDSVPLGADAGGDTGVGPFGTSRDAGPLPPADAAVMPCACASVVVSCRGGPGYANADRRGCALTLSPSSCKTLGLEDGAKIRPDDLLAAELKTFATPDELYDFCASKHEARHLCDGPEARPCATELSAYLVSLACLEAFEQTHCQPGAEDHLCPWTSRYLAAHGAAYRFNACLCASGTTCDSCLKACTAVERGDVLPMCTESASGYCPANGK